MAQAKQGDTVHVHYKGSLEDGTLFDSSEGSDPISFTIGAGEVITGFEEAIVGMSEGDSKTERITPGRGYGDRRDELVFSVGRDQMPEGDVEVGDMLSVGFPDGRTASVQITELNGDSVTLDANHPLAGK
ncbi:MAG TPA: FKBP-type peptidyl-prolyl cis-trans isomerase, partial [Thermoanaerobaculia bacterium]|nr:FKBP-type peptidyl-prolyl cis-trans isomerase [Thermoanaerobaculia bacterium]